MKNACRWKVIEIRPMPKVNSKYNVHGSGEPGVTQNRQQQHAINRNVATQDTLAANSPPAAQISTCSSRMTKSTEIHQNQQPQVTKIRVKPDQDAQNDLGGHETKSEVQKAGPKGPSVKPVAQRQSAAAHCRAPRCRSGGQREAGEECPWVEGHRNQAHAQSQLEVYCARKWKTRSDTKQAAAACCAPEFDSTKHTCCKSTTSSTDLHLQFKNDEVN